MILTFDFEEYKKKEKKHLKVSKKKMILTPERIQFKLDNLFDGDKTLGDNINQVLNDNWSEVYADVKASYEEAFAQIFAAIYNNLLGKVSVGELFGEEWSLQSFNFFASIKCHIKINNSFVVDIIT